MTVLAKNCTVQVQEERPHQDGASSLPVLKGQGGQVLVVTYLHPYIPPWGGGFYFCGVGATAVASVPAAATAAAAAAATAAFSAAPVAAISTVGHENKVSERHREDQPNILASLQIHQYWLNQEGDVTPRGV